LPEFDVPFSFVFVSVSILCALVSPLVAAAMIWALRTEQWRSAGQRAGITAGIVAAKFIATYVALHLLFGNQIPMRPVAIAVAGGAGFTAGALATCAWLWMKSARA